MKHKTVITILLTLALGLFLGACTNSSSKEKTDLLSDIQKRGKLVVALSPEFAPFEFKTLIDGKDTIVGSDIELAKAIAEELGVELELSPMSFDNVLASLQTGKADLAISGISATAERAKVYDFSDSYYTAKNVLIVKEEQQDNYADTDSLTAKKLAVQKGSVQEGLAKEKFADSTIVSLTSNNNIISELVAGTVDAVILEEPIAKGYIANNPGLTISSISIDSAETDAYAVALPKGNDQLKASVNKVIKELTESGSYDKMVQEAFELSISANQ